MQLQRQQDSHNSTFKMPLRKSVRPLAKVRFVYPVDETANSQGLFTLLAGVEPSKPIDDYYSVARIPSANEASKLQVPITPFPMCKLPMTKQEPGPTEMISL